MTFPLPATAYDIDVVHGPADRGRPENHGWNFGLPPGITPRQWPIDPVNGYPHAHGFTVLLPEDYRVHGPEIVALSFFGPSDDHINETERVPGLATTVTDPASSQPADPELTPFWAAAQASHPRLWRMQDLLGYWFAVVLLTRREFDGPVCPPPPLIDSPVLSTNRRPPWLSIGHAAAFDDLTDQVERMRAIAAGAGDPLHSVPDLDPAWHRALRWHPRAQDPNAGKSPVDRWIDDAPSDYQQPFRSDGNGKYVEEPWARAHKTNHIGGTMRSIQGTPRFSPFYIEFDDFFCGFNFGIGMAQLDFRDMKFDWACG